MKLTEIARRLATDLQRLSFPTSVAHVYNPLEYAWEPHRRYLERYGRTRREVLLVGMNPGPWGMAQTGVPFGTVSWVRDWLGIDGKVGKPEGEHPKRPVEGFACHREEVSGARVWGWAHETFGSPEKFFARFFIGNYCPLLFLDAAGRNITPDKLRATERRALLEICDRALRATVEALGVEHAIGIGQFAEARLRQTLDEHEVRIGRILHPSPASPLANRGWAQEATRQLAVQGISLPSVAAGQPPVLGADPLRP